LTYRSAPRPGAIKQRKRNIARAKQLLAQAGLPDGFSADLYTADAGFGMVELAVAVANQVKDAGIKLNVRKWPSDSYWSEVFLKKSAYVSYWTQRATPDILLSTLLVSNAPFNEPHFRDKEFDDLIALARKTANPQQRRRIYTQAMQRVHDASGWIIPGFLDLVHASSKNFRFESPPPPVTFVDFQNAGFVKG
jgi:peptide/nickel transport system substrate-binding protein